MKTTSRTEKKYYAFESAPRCGARTKNNNGKPCRCPAVKGKARCRIHGGAKGTGAPRFNCNALKHGQTNAETKAFRSQVREIIKENQQILSFFNDLNK